MVKHGGGKTKCYVVQVVYLEMLEKTMGRLGIGEENFHIGAMYIGVDNWTTSYSIK
jgi:hypothetical protein